MSYVYIYKYKDQHDQEHEVGIHVNTLDDLLNPDNHFYRRHNKFGTWLKLFAPLLDKIKTEKVNKHPRKRIANDMAKQIAITFFEELMEDIVENKVTYQFPYRFFAQLGIREVDWKKTDDPYQLLVAEPVVMFTEGGRKRVRKIRYYSKLTERWRNRLKDLTDKGQRFPKLKQSA